jgi:TonB-linked SusC/RagA family outer membrane protein
MVSLSLIRIPEAINTDWADLIFRTGSIRNYDLSISGGNEEVQYAISGGHFNQKGITKPALFRRSAARMNLDLNATEKLSFGTSISYSHSHRNRARNNDNISGVLPGVYFYPPNLPVYQPDGTYTTFSIFENPVAGATEVDFDMNVNRFIGNVFAEYEFTPDLFGKASWSYDHMLVREKRYNNTSTVNGASVNGSALSTSAINRSWTGEVTLNYITNVGEHNFNALIGGSMQARNFERTIAEGQQFPSDDFRYIEAAAVQTASSAGTSSGLASLFGRLQYNYDRRYLATLTVRRDASSRFGENNQWGTFPSIGLGWAISEESFFNMDWVSQLKLRASYGITGNQGGIGDYQSLGLWVGSSYGNNPGTITEQLANPDLKWETTRQFDIGLDIGFLNERITVTYDYYSKYTTDLLLAVPVPSTTGFQTLVQNFGELSNKGMELAISAAIIQRQDLAWTATFNIAGNRNIIEKLATPFNVYNRDPFRYKEGMPMFSFYFHKQIGVDPQTGAPIFADVNGDGVFNINTDRTIVGNANPDFFGGLTNTINFNQFDLSVFLQYNYGSEQLNWNRFFQEHGGTRNTGYLSSQLNRWQEPGDITMVPKMTRENYRAGLRPSRFVEDGSYIRLKKLTLGYSLPQELASKLGINNARIYFTGQNIFTLTNYSGLDPEVTATATNPLTKGIEFYTIPHAETYMIGFDITF